jgi:hypothetical protein
VINGLEYQTSERDKLFLEYVLLYLFQEPMIGGV